ncbi:2-dehydropantoate 2-reductase [Vibrio sp. SCSIO 43136]|uniref:2-dehydropantoate 2-reductase n=1 Tax=Vibrio sp. SCSIO 43136 TaxID=2819101 RepID=UPI0020758919|nr:2-dehydropantoate 2-reductase [Vibrio sp. SCSIO 43136]USD64710.1 2-dehydropantoate 2-reductase [Vibrio sp. SCSIO 43136]
MNITLVGPGAIGSLWAVKLAQAGHNLSLWRSKSTPKTAISLDDQTPIAFISNDIDSLQQCDLLLVTVKSWQLANAVQPLLKHLAPEAIILLMHNGMGAVDKFANLINQHPVVLATTTQAALKSDVNSVKHTGWGATQLGGWNDLGKKCDFLAEVLNHALPEVTWNSNIEQALWDKLIINCAINPLTAIHQVPNGDLAAENYRENWTQVVNEVHQVMTKLGLVSDLDNQLKRVEQVIHATAKNLSSMHQDIAHHRRSEVDFINGYVCQVAKQFDLATPANLSLYQAIKDIEQSWSHHES